jgi:hypothetical protein
MMKKFLVLLGLIAMFMACDYASDSVDLNPDVEVTFIDPLGWYVYKADTLQGTPAEIQEIHFIPENSVDCYLQKMVWEYFDAQGNSFYGPQEIALYLKIEGRVNNDPEECDTFMIYNIYLPTEPVAQELEYGQSAEARLSFIFIDEYWGSKADTATAWFGFYVWPDTVDAPETFTLIQH